MLRKMRERKELREHEDQQRKDGEQLAALRHQHEVITDEIDSLGDAEQLFDEDSGECPIVPKKGEEVIFILEGCGLTETRRGKGSYQGGSKGVSVRVAKGVTLRTSGHRGTFVQGPEQVTTICSGGVLAVTNQRAVYKGSLYSREFRWDKLLSHDLEQTPVGIVCQMPVENRQKTSGISLGSNRQAAWMLQSRVAFGVAMNNGRVERHLGELRDTAAELAREIAELEQRSSSLEQ